MTLEDMKSRKKELGYTYEQISQLSGIPLGTVQKIFTGVTASPRYDTLAALERVLGKPAPLVRETQAAYMTKRQGEYTLEDYYQIPDDRRVELIDGVIYDMSSPTSAHQIIAGLIYARLLAFVSAQQGGCLPMISPIDVQLDQDNRTMVQPDVIVVCDRDKVALRCVYGAPDFVVEVLSPATRRKDMILKLNKYLNAGVREYWLIDPDRQNVLVYDFESDAYPAIYSFDSRIPVALWEGRCEIDFKEIFDAVRFLYER